MIADCHNILPRTLSEILPLKQTNLAVQQHVSTIETKTELKPLQIGNLKIGFPVVQAALSGYSDWPMRVIARRLGAPYTICEVMLDQFLVNLKERKRTSHFLHISDEEKPVGGQLMGAEPEQFAAGAMKLVEAGFDIIDINFGCPVKKVLGRCRGGFHLSQPKVGLEIIKRTRDNVPSEIPVTLKMRRGIDDSQESRDQFLKFSTAPSKSASLRSAYTAERSSNDTSAQVAGSFSRKSKTTSATKFCLVQVTFSRRRIVWI